MGKRKLWRIVSSFPIFSSIAVPCCHAVHCVQTTYFDESVLQKEKMNGDGWGRAINPNKIANMVLGHAQM